jgi:hypothetical protein
MLQRELAPQLEGFAGKGKNKGNGLLGWLKW